MSPLTKKATKQADKKSPSKIRKLRPNRSNCAYDPKYCGELVEHSAQLNGTFTSFAAKLGVSRGLLDSWARTHKEFQEAKDIAKTRQEAVLEKLGIDGMRGRFVFHQAAWIFYMKARFGWSDTGPDEVDDNDLQFDYS